MEPIDREERRRLIAEHARKQLAEGTWPQVMAVFKYSTPKAPRTDDSDFDAVKAKFEEAKLTNLTTFLDMVRMDEKSFGVAMSYNLSMRKRHQPHSSTLGPENVASFFATPDILVGTRWGVEGAFVWLKNFSDAIQESVPEAAQIFDKIFGEALTHLQGPSADITLGALVEVASGGPLPDLKEQTRQ